MPQYQLSVGVNHVPSWIGGGDTFDSGEGVRGQIWQSIRGLIMRWLRALGQVTPSPQLKTVEYAHCAHIEVLGQQRLPMITLGD